MKRRLPLLLFAALLSLGACSSSIINDSRKTFDFETIESNDFSTIKNYDSLGEFNLINPSNGISVDTVPTFSWEASENAETYTLEICEDIDFISYVEFIEYYKIENLTSTTFTIQSSLRSLEVNYYWRVTAKNSGYEIQSSSVFSFYLAAPDTDEVEFSLGDADDWLLHSGGSHADIKIDNSNFFGNNKPALAVSFKKEDTNQGIPKSDGWIVVTKTVEKSIYGTDSLMLNLFYAGNDTRLLVRLVDKDNEYWFAEVLISNNAKQQVILKFSDFVQRFNDVPVSNRVFDFQRIKYMELVFEKCFGDGVCLISDVKAIKYANYQHMFIDKLHFDQFNDSDWTYESYNFNKNINGDELTLNFSSLNGYGFSKLGVNRKFATGDAVKIKVKYTGTKGTNIILRIYEEDLDRWTVNIPYSSLNAGEYFETIIPFKAFGKSYFEGDGKRQFYHIVNLQFGLNGNYGSGSVSFKDFEIVSMKDYKEEEKRVVGADGIIETFDNYSSSGDVYFIWDVTDVNKSEFMTLNKEQKCGAGNVQSVQLDYKSDMEEARYMLPTSIGNYDFNALSIELKDGSSYERPTKLSIYIQLKNGDQFVYTIPSMIKIWNRYVIPFGDFSGYNFDDRYDFTPETIVGFGIGIQYFNYDSFGKPTPKYTDDNCVYIDNLKLVKTNEYSVSEIEKVIRQNGDVAVIEDAEGYTSSEDVTVNWFKATTKGYEDIILSNDVSSEGGEHSIGFQYKRSSDSPSYASVMTIDKEVTAKGIRISLKGDDKLTLYINIYANVSGNMVQYRAELKKLSSTWTEYVIGFDNFTNLTTTGGAKLTSKVALNISKITFGTTCWDNSSDTSLHYFYLDNYMLDKTVSYTTNTSRTID